MTGVRPWFYLLRPVLCKIWAEFIEKWDDALDKKSINGYITVTD